MDKVIYSARVENDCLRLADTSDITFGAFAFLTGKSPRWDIRIGKEVLISRINGHIYISDQNFIVGEYYKQIGHLSYRCLEVDSHDRALLDPNCGDFHILALPQNQACNWMIA